MPRTIARQWLSVAAVICPMVFGANLAAAATVVPLSNLFDDVNLATDPAMTLATAIGTDAYGASAGAADLGVDRVIASGSALPMNVAQSISPVLQFDYANVGGGTTFARPVTNDAWGTSGSGPIRTLGNNTGYVDSSSAGKIEDGIGMHANGLITFDLNEIRTAGDLGTARGMFTTKIAQNDDQPTNGAWRATILVSDASGNILSSYINGQWATTGETTSGSGVYQFSSTIPNEMGGSTGPTYATVAIPDEAAYLTLAMTSGDVSADHGVWSGAEIEFNVNPGPIYLGNLFDDDVSANSGLTLADALATDTFKAEASANSFGVDVVKAGGMDVATAINGSNVQFDFSVGVGGDASTSSGLANDAVGGDGNRPAIRTTGSSSPELSTTEKVEEGIGMHANHFVTFDLDEIRDAGGLPDDLKFLAEGAINDSVADSTSGASIYTVALLSDDSGVIAGYVNGQLVDITENAGVWSFSGSVPQRFEGATDNMSALFDIDLTADVKYLTLAVTAAGDGITADHGVFSGARLTMVPEPSTLALSAIGLLALGWFVRRRK